MGTQFKVIDTVLADIVMGSSLATMLVDSEGIIRVSNEAAEQLFDGGDGELCGSAAAAHCTPGSDPMEPDSLAWCTIQGGRRILRQISRFTSASSGDELQLHVFRVAAAEVSAPLGEKLQDAILEIAGVPEIVGGDFKTASKRLVQLVSEVLRVDRVSLWLLVEDNSALECVSLYETEPNQHSAGARLASTDYPNYFSAFESGRAIAASDAITDPRTSEFAVGYLDVLGIGAMLDSIIRVSGKVLGVVCHEHIGGQRQWSQDEIVFASEVADLAAHAYLAGKHRETEIARARLEAELRQSQKLEAVGRLAGGVAHDFNNLLSIVLGHAELARSGKGVDVGGSLDKIQEAATRAAALTNQLLSIGRQQVLKKTLVDLNGLVADVLKLVQGVMPANIEVSFLPFDGRVALLADAGQLEQAILNICLNARDAAPDGGRIRLETWLDRDLGNDRCWAVLSIRDDGMGMTQDEADKVFEPFYSTKHESGGTGLGLSMVYGIVRQHDGYVELKSDVGVGTTFELRFPQCSVAEQGSELADASSLAAAQLPSPAEQLPVQDWGDGYHVLIAEDCPSIRALFERVFVSVGFEVTACENGEEALQYFQQPSAQVDLLMLDVMMPKMQGPDAARGIRALHPKLPIIFSTGYGADALSPQDLAETKTYVLNKPSTASAMLHLAKQVLGLDSAQP